MKRLRPGGLLVLEPQDWASYKKKRHLTREIRDRVGSIQMPPEAFKDYLLGLGLEAAGKIKPKGDVIKGFERPIRLFRKPAVEQQVDHGVECADIGKDGPEDASEAQQKQRKRKHAE